MDLNKIKPASKKIVERMKKLRQIPKPKLEDVIKQMEASARIRKKMAPSSSG